MDFIYKFAFIHKIILFQIHRSSFLDDVKEKFENTKGEIRRRKS
jgi:hypothetical protein